MRRRSRALFGIIQAPVFGAPSCIATLSTHGSDGLGDPPRRHTARCTIRIEVPVDLICQFKDSQLLQHPVQNLQARWLHPVDLLVEKAP
jgi:hypothetical protein